MKTLRRVILLLLFVVVATGVAWGAALTRDKSQSAIVLKSGGAVCGTLHTQDGNLNVKAGKKTTRVPKGATVTLIGSCP